MRYLIEEGKRIKLNPYACGDRSAERYIFEKYLKKVIDFNNEREERKPFFILFQYRNKYGRVNYSNRISRK